ncbi:glycosyltransferase [Enterococcus sp. CWB-B31]|uniref:glycosyltransferase n=1 Tax=Enterococcus sp. CWB-B31 TaxID=2885159 RepID=UPI001E5DF34A|nr:glycosyltransferase [Enterococcus sp. CWB-B31]MCB5953571.1 glycosyltransferase [Enterococcus sp. CWB-B31]
MLISVIIPVYNAEDTIEDALISIYNNQNLSIEELEIVIIDDGSTDNSREIINAWKNRLDTNIIILDGYHNGVSKARNLGLKVATGKFITFLDADDTYSNNHFEPIIDFLESDTGKETDIVAYPERYLYEYPIEVFAKYGFPKDYKEYKLVRNSNQKFIYRKINDSVKNTLYKNGSGLYPTDLNYHISQARLNVVIKNLPEDEKIYFDEELPYAEDSLFVTQYIIRKNCIGYVKEGLTYDYLKSGFSTVDKYANPVQASDILLTWSKTLIKATKRMDNTIPKYVQGVLLNEYGWRWLGTKLLPKHLNHFEYAAWLDEFKKILAYINSEIILEGLKNSKNWDSFFMDMIAELKGISIDYKCRENSIEYYQKNELVRIDKKVEYFWTDLDIKNNRLLLSGFFKLHFGAILNPKFFYRNGDIEKEICSFESSYSYYRNKIKTHKFFAINISIPLENLIEGNLNVGFYLDNKEFCPQVVSVLNNRLFPNELGKNTVVRNGFIFSLVDSNSTLYIRKHSASYSPYLEIGFLQKLEKLENNTLAQAIIYKTIDNAAKIWLYSDSSTAIDNAYYQFIHDISLDDGITRYYVLHRGSKVENIILSSAIDQRNIVYFATDKHKELFINAEIIISSFQDVEIFCPFPIVDVNKLSGLFNLNVVYLQHGVLHANMPRLLSNEKNKHILGIVTSTKQEYKNYIDIYGYSSEQLLPVGMPRFNSISSKKTVEDELYRINPSVQKRKLLYAPSWRSSVMIGKNVNGGWIPNIEAFKKSKFYATLIELTQSVAIEEYLKKQSLQLDIKLHPIFNDILSDIALTNKHVSILSSSAVISVDDYEMMITDFSSYLFDAVESKIPVIQFIPDYEEFRAGELHTYNELDELNEKNMFKTLFSLEDLLHEINMIITDEGARNTYLENMTDFFTIDMNVNLKITEFIYKLSEKKQLALKNNNMEYLIEQLNESDNEIIAASFIFAKSGDYIAPVKDLQIYHDPELTQPSSKNNLANQYFQVLERLFNQNGNPVFKVETGFVSSYRSNYSYSNDSTDVSLQSLDTSKYKFPLKLAAKTDIEKEDGSIYSAGSIIDVKGYLIDSSTENTYFVTSDNHRIILNLTNLILVRNDYDRFVIDPTVKKIRLLHSLFVYDSVEFSKYSKTNKKLYKYTTIEVLGIGWSDGGTPRLITKYGYISANKINVKEKK